MKTEEGRLKDRVKLYLKQLGAYYHMSVPVGYGRPAVDFVCCIPQHHNGGIVGRFVAIETKAKGGKPTANQKRVLEEVNAAGGVGFYCDSFESFLLTMAMRGLTPPVRK